MAEAASMQLEPYIFYYGRCEEALEFYKSALGGTYEINRFEGSPMAQQVPAEFRQKVMHATFKGDGFSFMASDGNFSKSIDPEEGNISLSLAMNDAADGERIFNALVQGGTVKTPFAQPPWGGRFGSLIDRFGIEWMVSTG